MFGGHTDGVSEEPPEAPSPWQMPPPPGWPPSSPPVWQSPPPIYAAPPGWQPPPPPVWQPPPPPPYGAPPDQATAGWHSVGGYPQPYAYPKPANTNGFAIASLVCSLVGILVAFIGPALGVIFGIVALRQTRERGEAGRGLAIAGIVVGSIVLLVDVIGVIGIATSGSGGGSGGISV
jgi:hypothetical protein